MAGTPQEPPIVGEFYAVVKAVGPSKIDADNVVTTRIVLEYLPTAQNAPRSLERLTGQRLLVTLAATQASFGGDA